MAAEYDDGTGEEVITGFEPRQCYQSEACLKQLAGTFES